MTSPTTSSPAVSRHLPPVPVVAATVLTAIRMAFGAFGLVYFGVFVSADVNPDAGSPSAVAFAAAGLLFVITALASLPGLWRGRRAAWHLLGCVVTAWVLFSCYKILVEGETESVVFLVVDVVVLVLLHLPGARRHVGV